MDIRDLSDRVEQVSRGYAARFRITRDANWYLLKPSCRQVPGSAVDDAPTPPAGEYRRRRGHDATWTALIGGVDDGFDGVDRTGLEMTERLRETTAGMDAVLPALMPSWVRDPFREGFAAMLAGHAAQEVAEGV